MYKNILPFITLLLSSTTAATVIPHIINPLKPRQYHNGPWQTLDICRHRDYQECITQDVDYGEYTNIRDNFDGISSIYIVPSVTTYCFLYDGRDCTRHYSCITENERDLKHVGNSGGGIMNDNVKSVLCGNGKRHPECEVDW
ncbi:hypothetical protein EJ08DRAFT_657001 [Tothia fuscella]|uniref:Uncharacterized protein n=1 Tax=Tothia fuscella TaxID=1048955 RepID=A0A9P4U2R1_9PEZI|nr:hypothetical protein EJ08DRAFT_657001 [Tothia fuscella]